MPNKENELNNLNALNEDITKKKKRKIKAIIISIIAILLVIGSGVTYFVVNNNPTHVFKSAINDKYKDFSKNLNDLNNQLKDLEKELEYDGTRTIDMEVNVEDGIFEDFEDFSLKSKIAFNRKNNEIEINAKLLDKDENILDGALFVKDDALYINSKSLLDGTVLVKDDLDEYITKETGISFKDFNLSDIVDQLEENEELDKDEAEKLKYFTDKSLTEAINLKLVDKIAKDAKDALIKSLNKENMSKTKETIDINDLSVKTNKYTYNLNEGSMKDLMSSFSKNLKDNKDMIANIAELTGIDKSDIKDFIDKVGEKDNYKNCKGDFSIYTTTILSKAIKYELVLDDGTDVVTISYSEYKDNYYFLFKTKPSKKSDSEGTETKFEIIGTPKGKDTEIKVKVNEGKETKTIITGTITEISVDKVEYDLTMEETKENYKAKYDKKGGTEKITTDYYTLTVETKNDDDTTTVNTTFKINIDKDEAKKLDIDLDKLGLDELTGTIKIKLTSTKGGDMTDYDIKNPKNIDDIKEEEINKKLEEIFKKYEDSDLFKSFSNIDEDYLEEALENLFGGIFNSQPIYTTVEDDEYYQDGDCWDRYTKDLEFDGYYSDYAQTKC